MRQTLKLCGSSKMRCHGCRFGMKPGSSGLPIQKPWGLVQCMPEIVEASQKTCDHGTQKHAVLSGSEAAAAATYPPLLCKAFAKAWMKNHRCS